MKRAIVVFEKIDQENDIAKLDFRLMRQALPNNSCPLAMADQDGFRSHCGQYFMADQVKAFAEEQSGYTGEEVI